MAKLELSILMGQIKKDTYLKDKRNMQNLQVFC